MTEAGTTGLTITPFQVSLRADEVDDLRERLGRTRWTDQLPGSGWKYGTDLTYLQRLCEYWQQGYDFGAYLARLNAYPQFRAVIEGEQIQFYHVRSKYAAARPLVLVHGWPGSVVEVLHLIERLIAPDDPADAFHVVVPSLPGYGYSGPTRSEGVNTLTAGAMIHAVMQNLGYARYFAQGVIGAPSSRAAWQRPTLSPWLPCI